MNTLTRPLVEAASLASEAPASDGTWRVRIISEGRGSSGVYTAELLENFGHAFSNSLSFKNHPQEEPQERDFTMITGRILGEVEVVTESDGSKAVYGNYLPDPDYAEKIARYKDQLGLSIYISGSGSVEESSGDFIVESFDEDDPFKSVDVVIAPGARGKFMESMQQVYSARQSSDGHPGGTRAVENKEIKMDQELKDALKGISDTLAGLVAKDKAAEAAEAQAKADEAAVASAVEAYAAAEKAIADAELLDVQVESLRAAAKAGQDIAPLIEGAKAVKEAAIKAVKESASQDDAHGVVLGESAGIVNPWKGR